MNLSRRQFVTAVLGVGVGVGAAACAPQGWGARPAPGVVTPQVTPTSGVTRRLALHAGPVTIDLAGRTVDTFGYGGSVPGRPLRATAGDRVVIDFTNDLDVATSVHWHGLSIVNEMDGVPGVTTPETMPAGRFTFDFVVPDAGTHWFHPHHGLQLDHGLYAPFIVDDPNEPGDYDVEWVVVLDDWTDGVGPSPEQILARLIEDGGSGGSGMHGMHGDMGMGGGMGGGMGMGDGDVQYPMYLVNGRAPADPETIRARPGDRIRLRIINAAADTIFTVAMAGHDMTVTHADGFPVEPVTASAIRIGMGERYDAVVTLGDGVFAVVAEPTGKSGLARALVRTGSGRVPGAMVRPSELNAVALTADRLVADDSARLPRREPDVIHDLLLSGSMGPYVWTINGRTYAESVPLTIRQGEMGRLLIRNMSMMPHPVHLHGHAFQIGPAGGGGARKDTVLVPAMGGVDVDVAAVNPGSWMIHCHNAYHAEAGMMTRLDYVT